MKLLKFLSEVKSYTVKQNIINEFYSDYPETPYISDERKADWIERARLFPKTTPVQKNMMKRYSDNLLPGHIYMLYWLANNQNKEVPGYFEYKYGIDFEKEKVFLIENGFLDNAGKPTENGNKAIKKHHAVIEKHTTVSDRTLDGIGKQIIALKNNIKSNGFKRYKFIANSDCCEICAALNGKDFALSKLQIGVNAPPMHDGCKCSIAAYEDPDEYEKWLSKF